MVKELYKRGILMNPYNGIERGVLSHILLSSLRYKNPFNGIERRLTTTNLPLTATREPAKTS
jgi:hypothetical protein